MSDTSSHSPDKPAGAPDDLAQRVESLLEEIDRATSRIEQAVSDEAGAGVERPTIEAGDQAPTEGTAEVVPASDPAETASAAQPPETAPESAPPVAAPSAGAGREPSPVESAELLEMVDADLEADLDRLLADERLEDAPQQEHPGKMAPRGEPTPDMEAAQADLEAELNELLRAGQIEAPPVDPVEESGVSALDAELAHLREEDLVSDEPEPRLMPEPAPEPEPEATPVAPASTPTAQPSGADGSRFELAAGAVNELVDFLQRTAPVVARRIEPAARRAARVMSRPLDDKPPMARQIVGWLALYTGFLAMCVWIYLLLFRAAPQSPPPPDAPAIIGAAEDE